MEKKDSQYVKHTQKDYSMSFKLSVISEIERGEINVIDATRKYGIQGRSTVVNWLRKFGTFDGSIKYKVICPKVKTKRFWNWNRRSSF